MLNAFAAKQMALLQISRFFALWRRKHKIGNSEASDAGLSVAPRKGSTPHNLKRLR